MGNPIVDPLFFTMGNTQRTQTIEQIMQTERSLSGYFESVKIMSQNWEYDCAYVESEP